MFFVYLNIVKWMGEILNSIFGLPSERDWRKEGRVIFFTTLLLDLSKRAYIVLVKSIKKNEVNGW